MAESTHIEWTDATWNPVTGCSVVSPGCTNCYAMRLAGTRLRHHPSRRGLTTPTKAGPVWNGQVRLNKSWLSQPLEWRKPRRIFTCAHGDLFAEGVKDDWILDVFTVQAIAGHHTFQVLTKRTERAAEWLLPKDRLEDIYANWTTFSGAPAEVWSWPLHNVQMGFSAERQGEFNHRWRDMRALAEEGWTVFVSIEPMLGPILLPVDFLALGGRAGVIVGGESGQGARPMNPVWVRGIRDQCAAAGVPFFFKQWGQWVAEDQAPDDVEWFEDKTPSHRFPEPEGQEVWRIGKRFAGRALDGVTHSDLPQVRR